MKDILFKCKQFFFLVREIIKDIRDIHQAGHVSVGFLLPYNNLYTVRSDGERSCQGQRIYSLDAFTVN